MNSLKETHKIIKCRDYTNYDFTKKLRNELKGENLDSVYTTNKPSIAWDNLKEPTLQKFFDSHAPLITKKVKGKKSPWVTRDVKQEINERDALQRKFRKSRSTSEFENFKRQRNRINIIVRKAKNSYSKRMLEESTNICVFYRVFHFQLGL